MSAQTPQRAQKPQLRGQRQQQTTVSMWSFVEDLLDRLRRTAMCMQSTPTASLDLSVMMSGPVAMLMWSVVNWATQEETPTGIPNGALFQVTLPWTR